MYKNYNEEKLVTCCCCGESVEEIYTDICGRELVCKQCQIDNGGDYVRDGELAHDPEVSGLDDTF